MKFGIADLQRKVGHRKLVKRRLRFSVTVHSITGLGASGPPRCAFVFKRGGHQFVSAVVDKLPDGSLFFTTRVSLERVTVFESPDGGVEEKMYSLVLYDMAGAGDDASAQRGRKLALGQLDLARFVTAQNTSRRVTVPMTGASGGPGLAATLSVACEADSGGGGGHHHHGGAAEDDDEEEVELVAPHSRRGGVDDDDADDFDTAPAAPAARGAPAAPAAEPQRDAPTLMETVARPVIWLGEGAASGARAAGSCLPCCGRREEDDDG